MVVSASYRTDIPGFYSRWFERRYDDGFCLTLHPFGGGVMWVPLRPPRTTGFVFWTRNIAPFMGMLNRLAVAGQPFVVQYTITGYPPVLEERVPVAQRAIALCHELRELYGEDALVWRYDPILITSLTHADYHRWKFARLCEQLAGTTNEVVVSFAQMYRKTVINLNHAQRDHGLTWEDPPPEWKREFLGALAAIAASHGIRLTVCAQRELLCPGVEDAACVDAARLARIGGREVVARRKAHRSSCGCYQSVDIGTYDTCASGCIYCYAVRSRTAGEKRLREHRPDDLMLWRPKRLFGLSNRELLGMATGREDPDHGQLSLFEYE